MRTVYAMAFVCALLATAGCGNAADRRTAIEPIYDAKTGKLQILKYDADSDGRPDAVSHMNGSRIVRIDIDENEDGTIERWEYYGEGHRLEKVGFSRANDGVEDTWSFSGADGAVVRLEISTRRDGRVTRTERYEGQALVAAEEDADGDGAVDKWETYDGPRLASVAFDTGRRGRPDRRLLYGPDGSARVEVDPDGDGTFTPAP